MLDHITVTVWSPLIMLCLPQGRWKVTNTFCFSHKRFPILQWEACKGQVSLPWTGSQFKSTGCWAHMLQKGKWEEKETFLTSILQNQRGKKVTSKILPCPICYKESLFCDQSTAGQIRKTLSFPLLTGRLLWIYWSPRAGEIFSSPDLLLSQVSQLWRHSCNLPPIQYN